jgi:KDO2-lipid IV(A) lauroyltransferase
MVLRALRSRTALGLVSDQNGGKAGFFAPFCGIPASCTAGAASLSLRTGAALLPIYCQRLHPGRHRFVLQPAISHANLASDSDQAQLELQTRINSAIQAIVLKDPAQWLLGHKRWKTRPAGEPPLY